MPLEFSSGQLFGSSQLFDTDRREGKIDIVRVRLGSLTSVSDTEVDTFNITDLNDGDTIRVTATIRGDVGAGGAANGWVRVGDGTNTDTYEIIGGSTSAGVNRIGRVEIGSMTHVANTHQYMLGESFGEGQTLWENSTHTENVFNADWFIKGIVVISFRARQQVSGTVRWKYQVSIVRSS